MLFKNFKEAHAHYKYPGSHRIGSYSNDKGIIRSYSSGEKGDIFKRNLSLGIKIILFSYI